VRTRKEIEVDTYIVSDTERLNLLLEVLLDMRDQLETIKPQPIEWSGPR
jgi:hypothetical protein